MKAGPMLVYDQPIEQRRPLRRKPAAALRSGSACSSSPVCCGSARSRSRRGLILACVAVMVGKSLTPRYSATAQLMSIPANCSWRARTHAPCPGTPQPGDGGGEPGAAGINRTRPGRMIRIRRRQAEFRRPRPESSLLHVSAGSMHTASWLSTTIGQPRCPGHGREFAPRPTAIRGDRHKS